MREHPGLSRQKDSLEDRSFAVNLLVRSYPSACAHIIDMGNVLQTQRLARAARSSSDDGNEYVSSVLQLVKEHPLLLRAKSRILGGTLFHWAAANGSVPLLEGLIRFIIRCASHNPADPSVFPQKLCVSVWIQATADHSCGCRTTAASTVQQELCQLLNKGVALKLTPLMLACEAGHAEAARILLQHGADPQLEDRRGNNTPLHIAAYAGHATVIKVSPSMTNKQQQQHQQLQRQTIQQTKKGFRRTFFCCCLSPFNCYRNMLCTLTSIRSHLIISSSTDSTSPLKARKLCKGSCCCCPCRRSWRPPLPTPCY
jgi:hypothetical protein